MPPLAAIIMRSKNEMPHTRAALEMLHQQTFRDFELFAVDSGSTDGSVNLLQKHCQTGHLTQIAPAHYVPGKVLNNAIARTNHEIIVLLNADAIPLSKTWLETLLAPILGNQADATFSRQIARPDARFVVDYDYQRAYGPENTEAPSFSAVACAFKRELWERHKFRRNLYAEDLLWATACHTFGATIEYVPESEVEHSHNYSLKALFRKKFRHGRSFAKIHGKPASLRTRLYLCGRELARDFLFACRNRKFRTIPYNIAYRVAIHAGLHKGLRDGRQRKRRG